MDKIIKVSKEAHKKLKMASICADMSLKDYMEKLSLQHEEGITMNVEIFDVDTLEAVRDDILLELERRDA